LKDTHYNGQPLTWEKQHLEAEAKKLKQQALGRESFSQHITAGSDGLSHLLAEDMGEVHSMTTLSEKSHEEGSPFKGAVDKSLRLQLKDMQKDNDEIDYCSPSKRSIKSEDDSPLKIRAGSPSKRKILASNFQKA
jgi:hypothetical protein